MDITIKAPYLAPKELLPAPLPTERQIRNAKEEFPSICHRIVRVGPYLVKYGPEVSLREGESMIFVKQVLQQSAVRAPEVYAMYPIIVDENHRDNVIVMEYIEGQTLKELWPGLTARDKGLIASQLRTYMDLLHAIPAPGYFGAVGRRPLRNSIFLPEGKGSASTRELSGPFDSGADFVEALVRRTIWNINNEHRAAFFRRMMPKALEADPTPVFSFGALGKTHVVRKSDGTLVLVSWDMAGWYPMYWEYAMATAGAVHSIDDWHHYLAQVLEEYPTQFVWMRTARRGHIF